MAYLHRMVSTGQELSWVTYSADQVLQLCSLSTGCLPVSLFIVNIIFYICGNFAETSMESLSEMSFDVDQVCSSFAPVISPLTTLCHPRTD